MTAAQGRSRYQRALVLVVGLLVAGATLWLVQGLFGFSLGEWSGSNRLAHFDDIWAYDYEAYYDAARRLTDQGTLYQAEETLSGPFQVGPRGLFLYSPAFGAALLPVTALSLADSSTLWYLAHVLAIMAACALMPVRPLVRALVFVSAALSFAVLKDAALGNVSVLLVLPMVMAWRWLDRPLGSVGQAIAISIRPSIALIPVWQLLRRQWRAVAWTLGAGLVMIVASLPFVGIDAYRDYLTLLGNISDLTGVPHNHDLSSTLLANGVPADITRLAPVASVVVGIAAMLFSLRRDRELEFMVTLGASMLLTPLLWDHYLAMLVIPAAFMASRGHWWALLLPLASWLPLDLAPMLVLLMTVMPFITLPASPTAGPGNAASPPMAPIGTTT